MDRTSTSRRNALIGSGAALAGAALVTGPATPAAADTGERDLAAIRQLSVNYALGTDAVAVGQLDVARERYAATFSADAAISAGFDRDAPALSATGPEEWLGVVAEAFVPYLATQHLLGSIDVVAGSGRQRRRTATMSTYLHATHVFADRPELLKVLGTYLDDVALVRGSWRIVARFLQFTSFETVPRTLP